MSYSVVRSGSSRRRSSGSSDETLGSLIHDLWALTVRTRAFLRRRTPTNILLDKLRTRHGLKWGVPAMGLALIYIFTAATCITLIDRGWSALLYLVFAACLWNALKFLLFGPISVILLIRARLTEKSERRSVLRGAHGSRSAAVARR